MEKTTLNKTIYECREAIESKNFELAKKHLKKISEYTLNARQSYQLKYLTSFLIETIKSEEMNECLKNTRDVILEQGREALADKNYFLALDYFKMGLYITNDNLFNYYIGKTYYKYYFVSEKKDIVINCIKEAKKYLNIYINQNGYSKAEKALLTLYYIDNITKQSGTNIYECEALEKLKKQKFKLYNILNDTNILKNVLYDSIQLKENDSITKMNKIITLYEQGNKILGDYYLKQIEKENLLTEIEKQKRDDLVKNKKLYISKGKRIVGK